MDWSEINELQKEIKKEENRQMIEGCMITSPDSIVSISELGKYIEGYDLRKNLKFGWKDIRTIAGYAIPTLFFLSPLLWVLIYPCFSEVSVSEFFAEYLLEKKNYFILVGCTVMGAFLVWGTWERITNWRSFPKGVLIYEGGLVWLTSDKYTKELKEHVRINFNDVNKIHCERHVHYKNESSKRYYDETSYELSIEGQQKKLLWKHSGRYKNEYEEPDKGGWQFAMPQSVLNQWAKVYVNRELLQYGYISFIMNERIVIREGSIEKDSLTIRADDLDYEFDGNELLLNRKSKKKGFFEKDDFSFNLIEMKDAHVLLYVAEHLLNVKKQ